MPIQAANPWISHSDLWSESDNVLALKSSPLTPALAGITAIEAMGGPKIPWQKGRSDYESEQIAGDHRGNVGDR